MLTFFDYLRQRAHDAVLAGVRDALTTIDGEVFPEVAGADPSLPPPRLRSALPNLPTQPAEGAHAEPTDRGGPDPGLPSPRRRGRPPKRRPAS